MKFGKYLSKVVDFSDPEWGPYWMNYKQLKKKINDIVESRGGAKVVSDTDCTPVEMSKSGPEVDFFRLVRSELKKTSDFFANSEVIFKIRHERVVEGYRRLKDGEQPFDKDAWDRLLNACVKFYKDVLLLENFAIMNYCGFSKILKKHDKQTGYITRAAFMRNIMSSQNFTHYPFVLELLVQAEQLFAGIQEMESILPLRQEERLFIEAMRDLNYQASRLHQVESQTSITQTSIEGAVVNESSDNQYASGDPTSTSSPTLDETAASSALFSAIERVVPLSSPTFTVGSLGIPAELCFSPTDTISTKCSKATYDVGKQSGVSQDESCCVSKRKRTTDGR